MQYFTLSFNLTLDCIVISHREIFVLYLLTIVLFSLKYAGL